MRRLSEFSIKHSLFIIILTIISTAVMAYFALQIEMNPNLDGLAPDNKEFQELLDKYERKDGEKYIFLMTLDARKTLTAEALGKFEEVVQEIDEMTGGYSYSIFNSVTFRKVGKRLAPAQLVPAKKRTLNDSEFSTFLTNLETDLFSTDVFFADNGDKFNTIFYYPLENEMEIGDLYFEIVKKLEPYFEVYTTGNLFLTRQSSEYMSKDLFTLLTLALIAILAVYYIGFRSRRALFLPVIIVIIGTIFSMGLMGILGFELTMISIVIPPLVLTIGTSYAIHFLNQYYHDSQTEQKDGNWIAEATVHVNKTIIMAAGTTLIGFLSLLFTSMSSSREFGLATSLGILTCAILSLTFLPASLSRMKSPNSSQKERVEKGKFTSFVGSLSHVIYDKRGLVILVFLLIGAAFFYCYPRITHQTNYVSYYPDDDPVVQSLDFVMDNFAGVQTLNLYITAPEESKNYFLDPENLQVISELEEKIIKHKDVLKISSFSSVLKDLNYIISDERVIPESRGLMLLMSKYFKALSGTVDSGFSTNMINDDYSRINITIMIYNSEANAYLAESGLRNLMNVIEEDIAAVLTPGLDHDLWGYDLEFVQLAENLNRDQIMSVAISMVLVFLIASYFFRSFIFGLATLIPLISGLMLNIIFMVVLKIPLDITTMMVTSVAIGVGVDDAIHYLLQFKKQITDGGTISDILYKCGKISGRPIALTTLSIVSGLIILVFASFKAIVYFGALVSLTLTFTMVGTLIVLPAVLAYFVQLRLIKIPEK